MLHDTHWRCAHSETDLPKKTTLRPKEPRPSVDQENSPAELALGMQQRITRRDFLNATLLASGSMLINPLSPADLLPARTAERPDEDDLTGYGGIGDYANSNGNTLSVLNAGHEIRDGRFESLPASVIDTWRDLRLRGGRRRDQRSGRGPDFSTAGRRGQDLSCTRQPSHLRRRSQAQRIPRRRSPVNRAPGIGILSWLPIRTALSNDSTNQSA